MTNFNFLSNLVAENEVNRALAAEKTLQNAGGGTSRHKALIIAKQFSQYCVSRSEGAHTSEQFSRYCVSRSEGAQVTSARSAVDVTVSSYGAPDEHPMSIRSASDGERWQNRVWKYVAMIFAVLVLDVGQMWGETVLKTIDFSDAEWAGTTFSQGNTDTYDVHNGVTFHSKSGSNQFGYSTGKLTFPGSNPSTSNYFLAFPIENIVDGRIIIRAYNGTSQVMVQYAVSDGRTEFSSSAPSFTTTIQGAPTAVCVTGLSNANKKAYVYIGRGSSSYTEITKIEVLTGGTTLTESAFYQTYGTTNKNAYEYMALAEFPSYLIPTNVGSISTQNNSGITVPEISSPHNFAGLSTSTTYYRIKNTNNNTYTLYNVANLKSVRFYGNGDGGTPTITTTVTKVSGSGSTFTVSTISTPTNNNKLIGEHTTGDLTGKSGYNADTYYDYTFKFTNNFDLWGIYVEAGSASGCPYYSFHTGGDDVKTNNTQSCFVNYSSTEEWQLREYTIPADTKFFVGERGYWYDTDLGSNHSRSSAQTWAAEMYLAKSFDSEDAAGSPKLGQATGATGTIRIYDNSSWNNLNAAFIPDGYKLKVGSTEYAMAVHAGNEYRSDIVEMSSSNARSNISVGVIDGSGNYVATANSEGRQHIFLNTGGTTYWSKDGVSNFGLYDDTDGHKYFTCLMTQVPGESYLYEGWVPSNCTNVIFVRLKSTTLAWGDKNNNVHNYTNSLALQTNQNYWTVTGWNGGDGNWSAYEKKGKFRMYDNSKDKNWYVRFVPYHVLHYDANGGEDAPTDQSVAADASPCQLTVSSTEPTRTDYVFQGWNPTKVTADAGTKDDAWDPSDTHAMTGDVTLYAVWQACSGPNYTAFNKTGTTDNTHNVGDELGSLSVTAAPQNGGTLSYQWYQYDDATGKVNATVAAGTNNAATYNIPNNAECTNRHYYCVISESGCSTTVESAISGALTLTEPVDPCSEPEKLTNEIARFFLPCGTSAAYNVEGQESTKDDNTFTTTGFNGDRNINATTGFIYGKLAGDANFIQLKLNTGSFRAGDVVNAYFYDNKDNDNLRLKNQSTGNALGTASASGYEYVRTYTLTAADIESDGSIKFFRKGSEIRVNRIIVTREPACFDFYSGTKYTSDGKKWDVAVNDQITTDSKLYSSGAVLTGGTITNTSSNSAKIGCNSDYGLVFDSNDKQLTITLTETTLPAGAKIYISAYSVNSNSTTVGFTIGSNACTEGNYTTTAEAYQAFNRSYTVTASDGIVGTNTFTIKRSTSNKVYLKALYIIGCEEEKTYIVTYKVNGGTGSDVVDDAATTISDVPGTFTAPGAKHFMNWNTIAGGTGDTYEVGDAVTSDLTLYAQWRWQLSYDANAGGAAVSNMPEAELHNPGIYTLSTKVPTRAGYTFGGWYRNPECTGDSFTAGASFTTGDLNETLYAKWTEDECTPTTLFSMVVADTGSDADVARQGGTLSLTTSNHLSTLTDGTTATLKNNCANTGSAHKMVGKDNDERHLRFKQNDHLLIVTLDEALAEGDIISFTGYGSNQLSFTTTETRATTPATSSKSYTIPSASGLIGATTIYIWRSSGSDTYIKSLTITRPCDETCKTPNITNIASTTNMTTEETKSLNVTLGNADALTGTVTYAWTNADSSPIAAAANASGANTARLTLIKPTAGTYTFKCTVTNNCGGDGSQSATSAVFTVVVTASTGCTEIAKVIVSGTSTGTDSGTKIAETGGYGVKLENTTASDGDYTGYKLGSNNYVYLQLASGEQFQNGDKVKVYITKVSDQGDHKLHIFQGTTAAGTEVATVASPALGWNEATLSNVTTGNRSLTIHRSSGTTEQNHYIYAFAVERCVDCTPATHKGLAYTKTSYTVGETASALTVTNPENVDTYQWKWNTTGDRTIGSDCGTGTASFTPPITAEAEGTRYYWCELTNDCGTVKTSAVGITVSAVLSDVTVTWTDPAEVNYGGGGYTIKATVDPAAWDGTLDASMLTAPEGIRIYGVEINNTAHTLQAKFDVQTSFDREANATQIPFALTLAATANYDGKIDKHGVTYEACTGGGGGGILFSQNFNDATEVAYTANTAHEITISSSNNIVGNTAASQFTLIKNNQKSYSGIAINSETGANSKEATGIFQAYYPTTGGQYALVKNTNFAATAPGAISVAMDIWFKQGSSASDYSVTFAVGDDFSNSSSKPSTDNVHSGFSILNGSSATLMEYASKKVAISTAISQGSWITITWVINNSGEDLEYTNPAGTKSTLENDKFDVWVGTTQFVSGQAATTPAKALQNLYIGDPNGKNHEFRLDNVKVTDISTNSGTGSLPTALTWSNDQASGATLPKDEGTADFAVTANRSGANALASLGTISYSSSAPSVATVNETTGQVHIADNIDFGGEEYKTTTITATLAASGCYKRAEITYVLRVKKHACEDVAGTVTSTSDGCTTTLTLSGYTAGATIQWYKDGVSLGSADGAQTATYETTASGEYYAVTSNNCDRTSNTVTVTSTAVSATKIVDEWYVKNGRRTPDIALVQTTNATGLTVTTGSPASDITSTGIGGCGFYLGTDGIIYLKGAKNDGTAPSDMTEGDTEISITASGCTDATPVTITIHRQVATDKYVLAYVVTGDQDGGWTQNPPAIQTTGVELYRTLTNHFDVQATNIYATTDEQKIKEYYSRYDIIFITDYPNTKTKNGTTKKSYVDALGAMIDIRPILTMEAWVSGLTNWSEKGVKGSPKSPTTRQYNMLLQCKDHEIFSGTTVETIGEGDDVKFKINMVDSTKVLYDTLDTKYGSGAHAEKTGYCYGKHPALQGFVYDEALADMLPLGLIDDGAGNNLQVGLERQKEMEARMMVLGINADAMERLSKDGETVIVNALKYLMKKDAEDIMDCSIYFDNASGDHLWSNVANWGPSHLTLPQPTQEARILQPCTVNSEANAASIKIISGGKYNHGSTNANGSLTIAKSGILKVGGRIVAASAPNYYEVRPTDASRLVVEADNVETGALIHGHKSGELNATVQLVSKAYSERVTEGGKTKTKKYWQYVGLPVQEALAEEAFYGGYTYKYEESAGWEKKRTGDMLEEFWGIGLSYDNYVLGKTSPITFNISGALALATNRDIELTKTAEKGEGENMIGNSWTAPIHLVNMTADDFENAKATIYIYNTGRDEQAPGGAVGTSTSDNGSTQPGQWISIPVGAIKLNPWQGPKVIPAMQAFEVDVADDATSGTLHLNYDKHVRNIATATEEHAPLLAPKRYMSEEPSMMRLRVADTATYTDLYLIEGEQLSDEFDNGWDGKYQQCDGRSATLYALSPIGNMAVLAQQSVNNTAVVFRPGRQSEYTFTFGYDGEVTYYLNDLLLEKSTEIREGNEYRFTYNEGDMESRFVVSSTPFESPNVTTGTGGVEAQEKVQKVIYNDHVYIIRGGKIYDVMGKMMK